MRMILALLCVWQVRLAHLDLARSDMLMDDADAAFARSRERYATASALAVRAGWPPLPERHR